MRIGDRLVYGKEGVATLVDIREERVCGVPKKYYVLHIDGSGEDSLTFVPTDNERLVSEIRPLLSRAELDRIITEAKARPDEIWIKDNRLRSKRFKEIIASGDLSDIIAMLHSIYLEGKRRSAAGKKNYLSDETVMRRAESLIYSEIAAVVGIPVEKVGKYIEEHE